MFPISSSLLLLLFLFISHALPRSLFHTEFTLSTTLFRGQDYMPLFGTPGVASDADIIDWGDGTLSMLYTCVDGEGLHGQVVTCICIADADVPPDSSTPLTWTTRIASTAPNTPAWMQGVVIHGYEGAWYESVETGAWVTAPNGDVGIIFSGYFAQTLWNSSMGIAWSTDGGHQFIVDETPILMREPGWHDSDDLYSPTVVRLDDGTYAGVYVGHCYFGGCSPTGAHLIGMTSADGRNWIKKTDGLVFGTFTPSTWRLEGDSFVGPPSDVPHWMNSSVAEPVLVRSPFAEDIESSCEYVLFFQGCGPEDPDRWIGVACSDSVFGPWVVKPDPLVQDHPLLAPGFVMRDERVVSLYVLDWREDPFLRIARLDGIVADGGGKAPAGVGCLGLVFMVVLLVRLL